MSARWEEALDAQIDLWRFWNSDLGQRYAEGFAESLNRSKLTYQGIGEDATEYEKYRAEASVSNFENLLMQSGGGMASGADVIGGILQTEKSKIFLADPIFVSGEMMDLVEAAAPSFTPEPLLPTDLICPSGFVLMPRSMTMLDVHQKKTSFRAFAWMPAETNTGKKGITISLYSYAEDALNPELDDYADQYADSSIPTWGMMHTTAWMFDDPVPPYFNEAQGWWRDVQCLLRISMQYISTRERQQPGRHVSKRTARAGMEEKYVTVVTLRRPRSVNENAEPSSVEWQNRWVVGGHWRNQWYPLVNAHRQIWISPYVKGPENRPLKLRKLRVFEVVR